MLIRLNCSRCCPDQALLFNICVNFSERKEKQRKLNQSLPGIHLHLIHIWYCWDLTVWLRATLWPHVVANATAGGRVTQVNLQRKRAKKPDTLGWHVTFPWEPICCVSRCNRGRELEAQTGIYVATDTRMRLYRSCLFWFCKDTTSFIGHCLWHPTVLFWSRGVYSSSFPSSFPFFPAFTV